MNPIKRTVRLGDLNVVYYEYGTGKGPTILLVLGTGLHARVWDKMISGLSRHSHVIAFDLRGHSS